MAARSSSDGAVVMVDEGVTMAVVEVLEEGARVGGAQALQEARKVSLLGEQTRKGTWASAQMKAQQGS